MPIKKLEKEDFVYLAFRRDGAGDRYEFRRELDSLVQCDDRDIIVDLTAETSVTESGVALLAGVVKQLQGTSRSLRIIAPRAIYKRLENHNLGKAGNVSLYNDHAELLERLNTTEKAKDTKNGDK